MGEIKEPDHEPEIENTIPEPDYSYEEKPDIEVMPDSQISYSERELYGYKAADILPLLKEKALELYETDCTVYMLFSDNTESMVFTREDILNHDGIFGIDAAEWIASKEYAEAVKNLDNSEASKEAALIFGSENSFAIYQLKRTGETRGLRFEPFDRLESKGLSVERKNYELVYHAPMDADVILINGVLFFHPVQNTHLWWIGSMFDIYMPAWMMVGILVLCIGGLLFISIYFIYLFGKYRNMKKVMYIGITFFVAGGVCMIVDIIFWGGSIDYIKLFDWFVFDLKDIYTKVYFMFLLLYYIPYMKEYIKMNKEERKRQGFLVWIKKGCPISLE